MTDESKKHGLDENGAEQAAANENRSDAAGEAAAETAHEAAVGPAGEAQDAAAGAEQEIARLEAENRDLKDRMLRLAAEMENLRKRTEREVKDARSYSVAGFARDMLAVADNLRRAIEAVPQADREKADVGALIEGVEMTERSMLTNLEKHGVKRLEPEGQKFDPHFHQAMFEVANPELPSNTVVQVVQAGYVIGERVLRPALVGVSKGGPKTADQNGAAEADEANEQAGKEA